VQNLIKLDFCGIFVFSSRYSVWLFSFPRNEGVKIWTRSKHFSFYFRPILKFIKIFQEFFFFFVALGPLVSVVDIRLEKKT
jgi:hypothetical protein